MHSMLSYVIVQLCSNQAAVAMAAILAICYRENLHNRKKTINKKSTIIDKTVFKSDMC